MGSRKLILRVVMTVSWASVVVVAADIDCATVSGFLSACFTFINYGSPDPLPGSPCCDAMTNLNLVAEMGNNRQVVCRCLMGILVSYNPNATAVATLPGFCGISLGFVIDPNADCTAVP